MFEAEFVKDGSELSLIDFNPRFFGQMGFDDARELPSAYLVYLAALGDRRGLARAVERAQAWRRDGHRVYLNRVALESSLLLERLMFVSGADEVRRWRRWWSEANAVDAVVAAGDRMPAVIGGAWQLLHVMRHPRSVVRAVRYGA